MICASRAEGLVARAGAPACTTGIGRGGSGRTGADTLGAGGVFLETAFGAGAALALAVGLADADGVLAVNGFFTAGLAAFLVTVLGFAATRDVAAGLADFFAGGLADGLADLEADPGLAAAPVAGLGFPTGLAGALAVFLAGAGLVLEPALAGLAAALVWGFKSGLLATALARARTGSAGLLCSGGGSPS